MAIPLPDLDAILVKITELRQYVDKREYYSRDRVAGDIRKLADMLNMAAHDHTYIEGYRRERDAQRRRPFNGHWRDR